MPRRPRLARAFATQALYKKIDYSEANVIFCPFLRCKPRIIKTHPRSQDGSQQHQRVPARYHTQRPSDRPPWLPPRDRGALKTHTPCGALGPSPLVGVSYNTHTPTLRTFPAGLAAVAGVAGRQRPCRRGRAASAAVRSARLWRSQVLSGSTFGDLKL